MRLRPHIRKRILIIPILLFTLLFFVYAAFCGVIAYKVKSFRKHPRRAVAIDYFRGNLPHKVLARILVFRRGTEAYNTDVMAWAYHSKQISDNPWNRWILENALANSSEEERLELLSNYPLTPTTRLIPYMRKALEQNRYDVLPLLSRTRSEEGLQISRAWIQEKILKPHNLTLFIAASGSLAESTAYSPVELINTFWPQLKSSQKDRVIIKTAAHLTTDPKTANEMFAWTKASLENGNLKMSCPTVALLGRFLSLAPLRDQALELLAQHANNLVASQVPVLFQAVDEKETPQLAKLILEKIKDKNPEILLELFHHVAHLDIVRAEELASPYLSAEDSEIRKGIIVLLIRHGSIKGKGMIDESFKGTIPRKTLYLDVYDYLSGSQVTDWYRRLSTHDYRETGKSWPPAYLRNGPSVEEVTEWKKLIATYPWFPGTDDAYYRLAFSQYARQDYQGSLSTIKEYLKRSYWPDNDARAFIIHLIRNLALASDVSDPEMPYLPHIKNIAANPLARMMIGSHENLDTVINSINWFLSNPRYIQFLNTNDATLKLMLEVAQTIKISPTDSICRLIAVKLENAGSTLASSSDVSSEEETEDEEEATSPDQDPTVSEEAEIYDRESNLISYQCSGMDDSTEEDYEVYRASTVKSVLYATFREIPAPDQRAVRLSIPGDPGEGAIRETAQSLNEKFSAASIGGIQDGSLDEYIVLGLLHSAHDFEEWQQEFKPTFDFLSAINNRDIPSIVAQRHLKLIEERRK